MKILIFIGLIVLFVLFPHVFIFVLSNIIPLSKWSIHDISLYFKHKEYNRCHEYGMIRLNCATASQVFGCGKTLMLVLKAKQIYKRYNDKWVYSPTAKCFVKQKVHIISNVELYDIPYIKFKDLNQFIDIEQFGFPDDDITIFLLDESGCIFNSRKYRDNISTEFLTRLLQSRKHKVALYMTSQRFMFTDKILREVCNEVTMCRKWWRIVKTASYDAYELENAVNPSLVKPRHVEFSLVTDKDYHSYNSYQLVEDLRKDYKPGDYLDTQEILATYGDAPAGLDHVSHPTKRAKRRIINTFK